MTIHVYDHERCGKCGDIRRALKNHEVEYTEQHYPPKNPDIEALEGDLIDPVLVDDELAPDGVVGHEEIVDWIKGNYS